MKNCLLFCLLSIVLSGFAQNNDSTFRVHKIEITGNKKTKAFIILRELTFKVNDTVHNWNYHKELSRKQLINLFLFNEISIERDSLNVVTIMVTERWYFWPVPVIQIADRNLNQWLLSKDPSRLIYGIQMQWYNIRGRNETMILDFKTGYTQLFNLTYRMPYFNKKSTWGLQVNTGISANRELWYKTDQNKVKFFRDNNLFLINRRNVEMVFTHRKKILNYHQIYVGYRQTLVKDTVYSAEVNPAYLYGGNNKQNEFYIGYQYTRDKRDLKGYPTKGHYLKASIEGPYFINPHLNPFPFNIKVTASKYFNLGKNWFAAVGGTARYFEINKLPYNRTQALGYGKDFIRGYELYVIDGNHFALGKSELKYRLINRKYKFLKGVPNYEKLPLSLYVTTYYDGGYVWNFNKTTTLNNSMPNSYQYGYGTGLNLVLFYDYCVRTEYSFNKFGQHRLFVQFVASI